MSYWFGWLAHALFDNATQGVKLSTVERIAKSGDLILAAGYGAPSFFQQFFTGGQVSHCGVIVIIDGAPYICESVGTPTGIPDYVTGRSDKTGPIVMPLRARIEQYYKTHGYEVYYRQMHGARVDDAGLLEFATEASSKEYGVDILMAGMRIMLGVHGRRTPTDHVCCSIYVAEALQACGALRADPPADTYLPSSFEIDQTMALDFDRTADIHFTRLRHVECDQPVVVKTGSRIVKEPKEDSLYTPDG